MAKGKLKKASQSRPAARLRQAVGAGPDEEVEVSTPRFERPAGESGPTAAPRTIVEYNALRSTSDAQRQVMGMRRWGRPEPHDLTAGARERGTKRADLTGSPMLWLFPGEWYKHIPAGYEVVSITYCVEKFRPGKTDNDIRFGCLAYGILVRDAS